MTSSGSLRYQAMSASADEPNPENPPDDGALDRAFAAMEAAAAAHDAAPPPPEPAEVEEPPVQVSLRDKSVPWATVAAAALDAIPGGKALERHQGLRAEEAWLRARLAEHIGAEDAGAEAETSATLARLLVSRGTDLDTAAALARRSLTLHDDPVLRAELAGWLAGIGQPALGAMTLRGLLDKETGTGRATTLVRLAVLLARAGDATGAADSLREASRLAPKEAIANELFGTLATWAPTEVAPSVAAAAYIEAAQRRDAAGDSGAAFEDRLRAFEASPSHEPASDALARALANRGRPGAADEIERAHGNTLWSRDAGRARRTHVRRMVAATRRGDHPRAVGALLDAGLDGEVGSAPDPTVVEVLANAGLHEIAAARLELFAVKQTGSARASAYADLARIYAGPLADEARALDAWIEAAVANDADSIAQLREHASKDVGPLVEALIRMGLERADPATPARIRKVGALHELISIAFHEDSHAPTLARWAVGVLRGLGSSDAALEGDLSVVAPAAREADAQLAAARRALVEAEGDARRELLETLAALYAERPDEVEAHVEVLSQWAEAAPDSEAPLRHLMRLTRRGGPASVLEVALRTRLSRGTSRPAAARLRMALGVLNWRDGHEQAALTDLRPLLTEAPGHRAGAALLAVLAARLGRPKDRAAALMELSRTATPALASVLLACAAELAHGAGAEDVAERAASEACELDPTCERAHVALATVLANAKDRASAGALEQAMGMVVPRRVFCRALADNLEALGEIELALGWTQRWLALTPGSPEAIGELIRRATVARSANRVHDALAWVLAQAAPLGDLAGPFADALELLFQLDPTRALSVARRTLDVFGPGHEVLRGRLLALADGVREQTLVVTLLERWAASGQGAEVTVPVLFEIARRRADAKLADGAARALARAAALGAPPRELLALCDDVSDAAGPNGLGADGLVALAEARATSLSALLPAEAQRAALAWRNLAGLRWDLAEDRSGAEYALFVAAQTLPRGGVEIYARDLREIAGPADALDALLARASSLEEPGEQRIRSAVLIQAAALAASLGRDPVAVAAAREAIALDPSRADAVAIIERSATFEGGIDALDETYDFLASAALGTYGRRAAHYRAARELERRGALERALRHAVASFEAVPSEGTSYVLLAGLAEKARDRGEAVRALERVAAAAQPEARAVWLKLAASLAGQDEEGTRTRFDILLRALHVSPDPTMVSDVGQALRDYIALTGEADLARMRFDRATRATLPRLDGPDGARAAVAFAEVALSVLASPSLALTALMRGLAVDGDMPEFDKLVPHAEVLASAHDDARALVRKVEEAVKSPFSSVGPAVLSLAAAVATALGEGEVGASLLVESARRAPEDAALVHRASEAAEASGQPDLVDLIEDSLPVARTVEALLHLADKHEREADEPQAAAAYERALATGELTPEEHAFAFERARDIRRDRHMDAELEALLRGELARPDLDVQERLDLARELSALLSRRGDAAAAIEVLLEPAARAPVDAAVLRELRDLARRAGDKPREVEALTKLADVLDDDDEKLGVLRELAALARDLGEGAVLPRYEAILRLDASDLDALAALEQAANERGDHEAIASLLARRIALVEPGDSRRVLRLRRAAVLEQRLGRLDEAVAELEALLEEASDDATAVRFLADLHERIGAPSRAAPLWLRASELSATIDDKAEYGLRACRCHLEGGDVSAARTTLEDIAPMAPREAVIEIRVELARRSGDARVLADALDQLASTAYHTPERRAALLLEAARAAASVGDDAAALEKARRAAKIAPDQADAVIEARRLLYRVGGAGAPREAQEAVDELLRIEPRVAVSDIDVFAFLLAEELDVIQGGGAGMRELAKRHAAHGPSPLVALGMAERLTRNRSFDEALPLFEEALKGPLRGLRTRGRVALAAAEAAQHAGSLDVAARLLDDAASEPDTRAIAQRRKLELTALRGHPASAQRALEQLLDGAAGVERARLLSQLARFQAPTDRSAAVRLYGEAIRFASTDRNLSSELSAELAHIQGLDNDVGSRPPPALPPTSKAAISARHEEPREAASGPRSLIPVLLSDAFAPDAAPIVVRTVDDDAAAPASLRPAALGQSEEFLVADLMRGSYESGEALIQLYAASEKPRNRDILAVRKRQVALRPGDLDTLTKLRDAASADGATPLVRAVEHVLGAFGGGEPLAPPPLADQREADDLVGLLLFRSVSTPVHEALALAWETGLYRKEMAHFGLTGVDRVQPSAVTPLADAYRNIGRVLGLGRTALYFHREPGSLSAKVALLAQPAVVLVGEAAEDTPELRFVLGAELAGAMPQHALVNAWPETQVRTLLATLAAAFGPVGTLPRGDTETAHRVRELWQAVSPRTERRLREIFAEPEHLTYEEARAGTRQAMWRAGLFACGDLAVALRVMLVELAVPLDMSITEPGGLAQAAAAYSPVADLVRLATRMEYAEARWQTAEGRHSGRNALST